MSQGNDNMPDGLGAHLESLGNDLEQLSQLQPSADNPFNDTPAPIATAEEATAGTPPVSDMPVAGLEEGEVFDDSPEALAPPPAPQEPAPKAAAPEVVKRDDPALNVIQEAEAFIPLDANTPIENWLVLPAGTNQQINDAIEQAPNIRLDDSEETKEWAQTLSMGTRHVLIGSALEQTVNREGTMYGQSVKDEGGRPMGAAAPKFSDPAGTKLTGERAQLRVKALLGMGSIVQIPLWHSGIWVTFKAPTDAAQLELQRRLMREKVDLGRLVHAMIYSNQSVFIAQWLIDFAFQHIYTSTFREDPEKKLFLREQIVSMDIPLLVWGLLCVMYPRGYPYAKACIKDPEKCNHVVRERLDISKLLWTDSRSLTPWQIAHMGNRKTVVTAEMLERYRSEFLQGRPRVHKLNDQISLRLRVPYVSEYINAGHRWINGIVTMVDRAFGIEPNDDERNQFINEQSKANNMRQFIHWVEAIEIAGMPHAIEDPETLELTIDTLSADDEIADLYFDAIGKYIDDSTISVVAIPTHSCPNCGEQVKSDLPRFPNLLPLDVMSTFFTLLGQSMERIRNR